VTADPVDLRLAVGAVAGWLAVFFGLRSSTGTLVAAATAAGAGGLVLLLAGPRWRATAALAMLLFCVALVLLPLAGRLAHALAQQHASAELTLTTQSDPVALAAKGVGGSARVLVECDANALLARGQWIPVDGSVVVLGAADGWRDVLPGQRVRISGTLQPDLRGSVLSVTLFTWDTPQLLGQPPWWQRMAGRIRSRLRDATRVLPDQERGLLPGLIDGDTSGLDPVLTERFRLAGLTHLVAVSGTNCSILVGAVLLVLRRLRARPWVCAGVGAAVVAMFVVVARPSPSVLRAALMAIVALASLATGRPRAGLPTLAAVVLALLCWQPTLAGSASFTMSVLATAALMLLAPGWAAALRRRGVPTGIAEPVAVAAAAHVVTAPVVAAISGRVSVVAIPANVLAEPVVAPITVLGFAAAVIATLWLAPGTALAWTAGWPCRWLVHVADFFGGLHGATVPWPGGAVGGVLFGLTAAFVAVVAVRAGPRRVVAAALITAMIMFIPVRAATSGWPPSGWVFAACDVGQGDALLLPAGPGAAVEIDAGPDPVLIDRCLRDFGIRQIPLLVLTHFHLDHVAGLSGAARGRKIGQIVTGPLAEPGLGVQIVHDVADPRGLTLRSPPVGTRLEVGSVHLEVLGPPHPYSGTHSDPNNSSLVLRAQVAGVRILLPGDAEVEAQQDLVAAGIDLRADVLKVPHHGSAYFDPDFLSAVRARVAAVSVGLDNDYGHPSPLLLSEMARLGVPLLRTDQDGDVAIVGTPGHLTAVTHGVGASAVGMPAGQVLAPRPAPAVVSSSSAWMATCRHARSPSRICRPRCRNSSCSWGTRTCSSIERSARSPPRPAVRTSRWPRPTSPAQSSRARNCTRCSGRRCSARHGCW
jgi:competence protein ComEC